MSVAELVPGPKIHEKVSRDSMVQRGFMLVIALYLVITLAFPLYAMLSKAFSTYQFNLDQFSIQVSDENGNFNTPEMTMRALNEQVSAFDSGDLAAKSGSRLAPTKLFPDFSFKSPILYRISGNDETAVFLVGSERHVGTEVVELDSNTFRRVVIRPSKGTGISNFTRYFSTPALFRSIGNSVFIAVLSTIITVSLAFWFAYALSRSCMKFKGFFRLVAMAPILVPSLLPGIALIYLFGNQGILKAFLMGNSIYGPIGIVVGSVFFTFPHAMLIIGTALSISDGRLYEAATALRASKWRTFWTVTIPSARYGLISAAFVVFNLVITDFGLPKVIGGQFNVLAVDIYKQVIGQQNFEMGAVVSVVLLLPAILAFAIDRYNQKKQVAGLSARSIVFEPKPNAKSDTGWFIYCSFVTVFILGIIGICQYAALVKFWPYDLSLSLNNYAFDKMDGGGWAAYSNSIKLGLLTAFFGTIIVFMGAY
ncbi:MAG: ABC transporter permease subunit, partial [Amylibacter sp.]